MTSTHPSFVPLGRTGLSVSRLSFGTVYFGSYGERLTPEVAADILAEALTLGVNTWDTSDDYETHPHVACALQRLPRQDIVVCSKITAPDNTLDNILNELGTDYLDILLAHYVELSKAEEWRARMRAWIPEKTHRRVRAIGLSTHSAKVAALAARWPEIDVLLLPINSSGLTTPGNTFEDGGVDEMLRAAEEACANGKGVLAMKVMGAGALVSDPASAIRFAASLPYVHSLCIGMRNVQQVKQNLQWLHLLN